MCTADQRSIRWLEAAQQCDLPSPRSPSSMPAILCFTAEWPTVPCRDTEHSGQVAVLLNELMCAADPASLGDKFEGPPLVGLDPDVLGPLLSSGIHTRRQDLWDAIWTALSAAGLDVAQPPGIRTDAHDFVRDGLHMSRCPVCFLLYTAALCLMPAIAKIA